MFFWEFVKGWWPLRNKPNVLMLHFSEMKKDHKGSVEKIAKFLGYEPTAEQWPKILEYTSFPWMKENGIKFRAKTLGSDVPALLPHAMVRKGAVGDAKADGMTDEIAADMKEWAMKMVGDEAAVQYLYEGGSQNDGIIYSYFLRRSQSHLEDLWGVLYLCSQYTFRHETPYFLVPRRVSNPSHASSLLSPPPEFLPDSEITTNKCDASTQLSGRWRVFARPT
eukprot:m.416208 g.416208  ORF g.416208 m.416208 type:complete len:222 (+) comp16830_c1_seq1:856-1521(+)